MKRRLGPVVLAVGILCGTCAWAQNRYQHAGCRGPHPTRAKAGIHLSRFDAVFGFPLSVTGEQQHHPRESAPGSHTIATSITLQPALRTAGCITLLPIIALQQFRPKLIVEGDVCRRLAEVFRGQATSPIRTTTICSPRWQASRLTWQLTAHWQLVASESFIYTADPFQSYVTSVGTPTMNNPNPVTYYPLTQYTTNNALLALSDQLTRRDTLTFSGTEYYRDTSTYNLVTSVPFYNLVSYGGRVDYSHRMSARLSLGGSYDYNSLDFGGGVQRSGIQTMSMTANYQIRPSMSISGWVGPEYTGTKTLGIDPNTGADCLRSRLAVEHGGRCELRVARPARFGPSRFHPRGNEWRRNNCNLPREHTLRHLCADAHAEVESDGRHGVLKYPFHSGNKPLIQQRLYQCIA